jgi:tRNA dimethylallyltransferase
MRSFSAAADRGICLTGPTGCGKTELALALAAEFPLEIVSMDSAMVYRGLDIGTAKPTAEIQRRHPHHLIDIREPEVAYSAGEFRADAAALFAAIRGRGKWPLVVGGTLLYLRALRDGLAILPRRDPEVRAAIDKEGAEHGWDALHARLSAVDPETAARIDPRDRQRVQRALEVYAISGRPLGGLLREHARSAQDSLELVTFALVPDDRAALAQRLEQRFDAMVGAGLVDEVRKLHKRPGLRAEHASMRCVGYRQIWAHLEGEYDWAEARRRAVSATRQLAKRQLTWLRSERGVEALPATGARVGAELAARVRASLERWA